MIPFLKKNKDGKKPPKSTVPRTAQESIPFQRMFEDGTCRVRPGYYTRTIQYQDINYQLAQQEDKTAIFEEYTARLRYHNPARSSSSFQDSRPWPAKRPLPSPNLNRWIMLPSSFSDCILPVLLQPLPPVLQR